MTHDYEIWKNDDFICFERDHGACYGGVSKTTIDCEGKKGMCLYKHIKEYAGKSMADAAEREGFCCSDENE